MHSLYSESWNNALHTPVFVLLNEQQGRELNTSVPVQTVAFFIPSAICHTFKRWQQRAGTVKLKTPDSSLVAHCKVKTAI